MPVEPHEYVDDGGDCKVCPLPAKHPKHIAAEPTILAPVDAPEARVGRRHPWTSHAAAAKALPKSGTVKGQIFARIASRPQGATDDELENLLARSHQSVSAARNSLMNDGWIEPLEVEGVTVTRHTKQGNAAMAWTLTAVARRLHDASRATS